MRKARVRVNDGLSLTRGCPRVTTHFFAGSAGFAGSVAGVPVAGIADEPGVAVVLVVDGSPAGLLSLPPQAARTAMADRTKSFFMMVASEAHVLRCFSACRQEKVAIRAAAVASMTWLRGDAC